MAKINSVQNSFQSGELSPGMYGRSDEPEFQQGAKTISNFIVRPNGGLTRRPGTQFMGATKADLVTRLIPFPVKDRRFVIEVTPGRIRVWEEIDGTLALYPTNQTYRFPPVSSVIWGTATGQFWELFMDRADFPIASGMGPYAIANTGGGLPANLVAQSPDLYLHVHASADSSVGWTNGTFDEPKAPMLISFYASASEALENDGITVDHIDLGSSNGTGSHRLITQNAGFETVSRVNSTNKVRWARSDDELWLTEIVEGDHRTNDVYKIRYFEKRSGFEYNILDDDVGEGRIEIEWINASVDGPFHTFATTTPFDSPSENLEWTEDVGGDLTVNLRLFTMGHTTVGHGATAGTSLHSPEFDERPIGIVYGRERVGGSTDAAGVDTNWGVGTTLIIPASTQDGWMLRPFTRGATRIDTDFYAFGPTFTNNDGIQAIEIFQDRVCLAGGILPGTVSFGSLEQPMLFIPANIDGSTIDGSTSFQIAMQGDRDQRIHTMVSTPNKLFVITRQGVFAIAPSSGIFAFDSFDVAAVNRIPGSDVNGVTFGDFIAYVTADKRQIMAVDVNEEGVKFNTFSLTRFSDHILEAGVNTLAHQRSPGSVIWAVLDDGEMASTTFDREAGIIAAAQQIVAGDTVEVQDAISMPFHDGTEVVYLIVQRDINSVTKRYIEMVPAIPKYSTAIEDHILLDSAGIYDGAAVTNVPATTFDHLNGETGIDVYADGVYIGTRTISGGQFTVVLDDAASKIYAGYRYNSDLELLRPVESFPSFGSTEGSLKRNIATVTQFANAFGGKVGPDANDLQPIEYESTTPALFTGERETPIDDDHKRDAVLLIRADEPYPMDITAVVRRVDYESRGGE